MEKVFCNVENIIFDIKKACFDVVFLINRKKLDCFLLFLSKSEKKESFSVFYYFSKNVEFRRFGF